MNPRSPCGRWAFLGAIAAACVASAGETVRISQAFPPGLFRYSGRIDSAKASKRFDIPWSDGEVSSVTVDGGPRRYVKWWQRSDDGRTVRVAMEWVNGGEPPALVTVEAIPSTGQTPDGRWSFRTSDAATTSAGPHAMRIHEWNFHATRGGNYTVEITGGAWDERTEAVEVELCGQTKVGQLDYTGGKNRVGSKPVGRIRIPGPGPQRLRVLVGESNRGLQGHLDSVVLRPAPEGGRQRANEAATYTLRAADAALAGEGLTVVGWGESAVVPGWSEEAASLDWTCDEVLPGRYRVEFQGRAGADAAGEIEVRALGQSLRTPLIPGGEISRVLGEIEVSRRGDREVSVRPRGARGTWSVTGVRVTRVP